MADYSITFAHFARKELEALPNTLIKRILKNIEALSDEPRPNRCRKLQSFKNLRRIRIGDYRVIYSIDDTAEIIDVIAVRHRREVYG